MPRIAAPENITMRFSVKNRPKNVSVGFLQLRSHPSPPTVRGETALTETDVTAHETEFFSKDHFIRVVFNEELHGYIYFTQKCRHYTLMKQLSAARGTPL